MNAVSYRFFRGLSCGLHWSAFHKKVINFVEKKNLQIKTRYIHLCAPLKNDDSKRYSKIHGITLCSDEEMVQLSTLSGKHLKYPWIWLRDNCQCPSCFNPQLQSRTINWQNFDITVHPTSLSSTSDSIQILWSDGHRSDFGIQWLEERAFSKENQERWLNETYKLSRIPWSSAEFPHILTRFNYKDVIESDSYLFEWLKSLAMYGVSILEHTPHNKDQLRKLASRVSFIKKTHYGEEFIVRNDPSATNIAYLSTPLQMHADLPYYEYKPGVNLLHCLVQTVGEGGENQLTDCLHVYNLLKETQTDIYKILTTVPVNWCDIGEENSVKFYSLFRSPTLCEDRWGQFYRVNYSNQQRDSHFSVPLEDVFPWYKAQAIFTHLLYHPNNMVIFKTKPGDILTFDNIRMAHGRTGYNDVKGNERYLIGAYLDWDTVYSRIRVLQTQFRK